MLTGRYLLMLVAKINNNLVRDIPHAFKVAKRTFLQAKF